MFAKKRMAYSEFCLPRVFLHHCTSVGEVVLKDYAEELLAAVLIAGYHMGVSENGVCPKMSISCGNMMRTHGTFVYPYFQRSPDYGGSGFTQMVQGMNE